MLREPDYLSWVEMLVNLVFSELPRPFTTAMIATEMPAAMRPYSMAGGPEAAFTKRTKRFFIGSPIIHTWLSELIQSTGLPPAVPNHGGHYQAGLACLLIASNK